MAKFAVDPLKENSIMYLYAIRDEIDFSPSYQRQSDIWPLSKRQLLIDSLINGFDLPKIYFHEISKKKDGRTYRYAVIDGKQRLESIFNFIDGKFAVANDFQDLAGVFGQFAGLTYRAFGKASLKLKARFEVLPLPIYIVRTADLDLIEEMFSRLNEASPLNAPEKRNAFGGPVPGLIREICKHTFFQSRVPFDNRRYRHYDVAAKLLLLTDRGRVVDTKKVHLDRYVKSYVEQSPDSLVSTHAACKEVLDAMTAVFQKNDSLLRLVTIIPVLFGVFAVLLQRKRVNAISRERLKQFDQRKRTNRALAQRDEVNENINYDWLEFDRLTQSPNDSSAIEFKINILLQFLDEEFIANQLK